MPDTLIESLIGKCRPVQKVFQTEIPTRNELRTNRDTEKRQRFVGLTLGIRRRFSTRAYPEGVNKDRHVGMVNREVYRELLQNVVRNTCRSSGWRS